MNHFYLFILLKCLVKNLRSYFNRCDKQELFLSFSHLKKRDLIYYWPFIMLTMRFFTSTFY